MTRTPKMVTLSVIGLTGALAVAGCGAVPDAGPDVADEVFALQQIGVDAGAPVPAPSASAAPDAAPGPRRAAMRRYLRRNTLHGEVAVRTAQGPKTIVVQRGAVTAVTGHGVTVASTDGYTLSWTFGDPLTVRRDGAKAGASALATGETVGIAGTREGGATDARLIVIR